MTSAFSPRLERRGVRMSWRGVMPGGAGPQLPGDEFSATWTLWVKQRSLIPAGSCLQPQGKECRVPSQLCRGFSLLGRTYLAVRHRLGTPLLPEGFCSVRTFAFSHAPRLNCERSVVLRDRRTGSTRLILALLGTRLPRSVLWEKSAVPLLCQPESSASGSAVSPAGHVLPVARQL